MTFTSRDLTDGTDPMSYAEIDELKRLAGALPPDPLIINIGAADGVSALAFAEARPDALIWSLDVLPCEQELANLDKAGFGRKRVVRLLGRSQDIGERFPFVADMVFVDGDHHYSGVRGDIAVWADKVRPGGFISFHDYIEFPPPNNVTEAFVAVNDAPELQLPEWAGVGVVDRIISFQKKGK